MKMAFLLLFCLPMQAENPENSGEEAKQRLAQVEANIDDFRFTLTFVGPNDKPYYDLDLSVSKPESRDNPFHGTAQIDAEQAKQILTFLTEQEFWRHAVAGKEVKAPAKEPFYVARVTAGEHVYTQALPWDLTMFRWLDGLQAVLADEAAAKNMAFLIGRISGHRGQLLKTASLADDYTISSEDMQAFTEGDATVFLVKSDRGIGRAKVTRKKDAWPEALIVRLNLRGLEGFRVTVGSKTLHVFVNSGSPPMSHAALITDGEETELKPDSPYWTEAKLIGPNPKIPLAEGYFELKLPAELFKESDNPESIDLHWIDFYR